MPIRAAVATRFGFITTTTNGAQVERIRDADDVPTEVVRDGRGNTLRRTQQEISGSETVYHITLLDYNDPIDPDLLTQESLPFVVTEGDLPTGKDQYDVVPAETGAELIWATTSTYDPTTGDLTKVTDALGNTTTFQYNEFGQPTSIIDPEGNRTFYQYDADTGNLEGTFVYGRDANGDSIIVSQTTFQYDNRGNLLATYDAEGNLQAAFNYNS